MIFKLLYWLMSFFVNDDRKSLLLNIPKIKKNHSNSRLYRSLLIEAKSWSAWQHHLRSSDLSKFDIQQIYEISFWPELVKALLEHKELRNLFFKWSIRDKNQVEIFARYPEWAWHLLKCNLSERLGRLGSKSIRFDDEDLWIKFEGEWIALNSLDQVIVFKNYYRLTLAEIFKIFESKQTDPGNLELMADGIINWNVLQLGVWSPFEGTWSKIDLERSDWYKELPPFETLTLEDLKNRYHVNPQPGEWIVSAASTRGRLNLDFNNTHAFLEIAIPDKNQNYSLYDFGKFAAEYPKNVFDKLKMLCRTSNALVTYPDENVFYTFREQALYPVTIYEYEGLSLLKEIKEDILTGWRGNLIYQIESENCAKWVYFKLVQARGQLSIPDLFRMSLLDTEPGGPIGWIFKSIKQLPEDLQVPVLTFLHLPLGAFQSIRIEENGEEVIKSLRTHEFFDHGQIFLPALLNHKSIVQSFIHLGERLRLKVFKPLLSTYKYIKVVGYQWFMGFLKWVAKNPNPFSRPPDKYLLKTSSG